MQSESFLAFSMGAGKKGTFFFSEVSQMRSPVLKTAIHDL